MRRAPTPIRAAGASVRAASGSASRRLRHTVSFHNEGSANRAKPAGVRGAEIGCFIRPGRRSVTVRATIGR